MPYAQLPQLPCNAYDYASLITSSGIAMNRNRRRLLTESCAATAALVAAGHSGAQTTDAACAGEAVRLARNKQTVRDFYDLAFNQSKPAEAIARYTGATYIQHNPEVADGKEGFIAYFTQMAQRYGEKKRVEFKRMIAEADMVTVHCHHWFGAWHGDSDWAGIDIFRLDAQGKIVEHWDVLQKVPRTANNKNGMF
jgi:predicted SnoaL-like aldol condensation-catalyzing enzyme